MEALGFGAREEAELESLTAELVRCWAIEGETHDPDEVRSSIAHVSVSTQADWRRMVWSRLRATHAGAPVRVARRALARADGATQRYSSLSAQIEPERREKDDQLERAQRGGQARMRGERRSRRATALVSRSG